MKSLRQVYVIDPFGCVRAYAEVLASHLNALMPTQLLTTGFKDVRGPRDRGDGSLNCFFLRHSARLHARAPWLPRPFLKALGLLEYACLDLPCLRRLRGPEVLFHWQWVPLPWLTLALLRLLNVPIDVLTSHDPLTKTNGLALGSAARVVLHGRSLEAYALAWDSGLAGKTRVIPHGLLFATAPSQRRVSKVRRVGFVGLIKDYKGLETLFAAWRKLDKDPSLRACSLSVSGDCRLQGPARTAFLESLKATPRTQAELRFLSEEGFIERLQSLDLLVLPYLSAGQSGVALSALGLGIPMLLSRTGALPELLEGAKGDWTFEAGDVDALAGKIRVILRMSVKDLRTHKNWLLQRSSNYDPAGIAKAHLKLYRQKT